MNKYSSDFFRFHRNYSYDSAQVIVPLLLKNYDIDSVIDIGCGNGAWLKVFQENGIKQIYGYDYSDLPVDEYFVEKSKLITGIDFSKKEVKVKERSDLVVCLELVEHLPKKNSKSFIRMLTECANVVLFSAAIPGQTGENHINEQLPGYWRSIFNSLGYIEIDFIKQLIWKNTRVAWWYRQNITLYVNKNYMLENKIFNDLSEEFPQLPEDQNLTLISERILNSYKQKYINRLLNYIQRKIFLTYD